MSIRWTAAGVLSLLWIAVLAAAQQGASAPGVQPAAQPAAQQGGMASGGAQRGVQTLGESAPAKHGHQYLVAIGIDHYDHWLVLNLSLIHI